MPHGVLAAIHEPPEGGGEKSKALGHHRVEVIEVDRVGAAHLLPPALDLEPLLGRLASAMTSRLDGRVLPDDLLPLALLVPLALYLVALYPPLHGVHGGVVVRLEEGHRVQAAEARELDEHSLYSAVVLKTTLAGKSESSRPMKRLNSSSSVWPVPRSESGSPTMRHFSRMATVSPPLTTSTALTTSKTLRSGLSVLSLRSAACTLSRSPLSARVTRRVTMSASGTMSLWTSPPRSLRTSSPEMHLVRSWPTSAPRTLFEPREAVETNFRDSKVSLGLKFSLSKRLDQGMVPAAFTKSSRALGVMRHSSYRDSTSRLQTMRHEVPKTRHMSSPSVSASIQFVLDVALLPVPLVAKSRYLRAVERTFRSPRISPMA
mmetsp:Transcript_61947/g.191979  ORF Transcript_61947/g.191979 Transcript_61947/m.191979 type:complete len:375 (-) Transcript_61947:142-1266(-)